MKKVLGFFLLSSIFYAQASSSPESLGGSSSDAVSECSVEGGKRKESFPFIFEKGKDSEGGDVVHILSPTIGPKSLSFFPGELKEEATTPDGGRKLVTWARMYGRQGEGRIERTVVFNPKGQMVCDQSKVFQPGQVAEQLS